MVQHQVSYSPVHRAVPERARNAHHRQMGATPFKNYISQTTDITKPKNELLRIHPFFHFFPGTTREIVHYSSPRKDGKLHLFNTIQNNDNARNVIVNSLKSMDLYRIGIATHVYADTFCHQNFVGLGDSFNNLNGNTGEISPKIGHAGAGHKPDIPGLVWFDKRYVSSREEIHNKKRILDAAGNVFLLYCEHCTGQKNAEKKREALIRELDEAIGEVSEQDNRRQERVENYKSVLQSICSNQGFRDYDEEAWFHEAVSCMPETDQTDMSGTGCEYRWKKGYEDSDWFKFQGAVKFSQAAAESILKPLLIRVEVTEDIW